MRRARNPCFARCRRCGCEVISTDYPYEIPDRWSGKHRRRICRYPAQHWIRRVGCFSRSIQHLLLPPTATAPWPTLRSKGHTLVLLKPSTYMNLSGKAVRYWLDAEKIPRENLLVVVDDIALPFGTFRMRTKGSAGGHNGLKNITELLGTEEYSPHPLRHRRRLPARTPGGLRTGALERRRAQGDARTTQILRRRDSLVRRDRPRTDDESLQQEMTRRTETEKPQPLRCGFFIRRTGFSPRKR